MENELGFRRLAGAPRFCSAESRAQPSISDEWLARVGLLSAQVGVSFAGPGLHCFKIRAAGWVTGHVLFLGRTGISCWARFALRILSIFSFSET
jgi:hypothetical protein